MPFKLLPPPKFRYMDSNNENLSGGKVYTYVSGTSTPLATYTDSTGGTENDNPVILDAQGYANIWLDSASTYRIVIKDANDATISTTDGVTNADGAAGASGTFQIVTAGGTVDAITADYSPNLTLTNLVTCAFVATGANTSTTPTFSPDGLTARTITKKGGQPLVPGDIPAALAVCIVEYNSANTRWELLNPATDSPPWVVATGTADALTATYAPAIPAVYDGLLLSFRAAAANATTAPTFAPNGLTARTIVRNGGSALVAGNIAGNLAEYFVRYNSANTRWELLNPTPIIPSSVVNATSQSTPSDPTGTTSASQVMMGLAGSITPTNSGKVLITISGSTYNTGGGTVNTHQIRYGTGSAPTNGAAATGTTAGSAVQVAPANGSQPTALSLNAVVTGLTPSTAYWIDVGLGTASGTASIKQISISTVEV